MCFIMQRIRRISKPARLRIIFPTILLEPNACWFVRNLSAKPLFRKHCHFVHLGFTPPWLRIAPQPASGMGSPNWPPNNWCWPTPEEGCCRHLFAVVSVYGPRNARTNSIPVWSTVAWTTKPFPLVRRQEHPLAALPTCKTLWTVWWVWWQGSGVQHGNLQPRDGGGKHHGYGIATVEAILGTKITIENKTPVPATSRVPALTSTKPGDCWITIRRLP